MTMPRKPPPEFQEARIFTTGLAAEEAGYTVCPEGTGRIAHRHEASPSPRVRAASHADATGDDNTAAADGVPL